LVVRSTLISLGVTLGIGIVAALLLARFRGPLENIFQSAGQAVGGFVTKPLAGFIQGISGTLGGLEDIQIKIPSIIIKQGTLEFTGADTKSSLAGETVPFGNGSVFIPEGCTVLPDGRVSCPTPPIIVDTPPPPPPLIPEAEATGLTLFGVAGSSILVGSGGEAGFERLTREEILAQNPNAVGLFDLLSTKKTEFLPLGVEAVKFFQEAGQELRLSAQLFEEIPNIRDVV